MCDACASNFNCNLQTALVCLLQNLPRSRARFWVYSPCLLTRVLRCSIAKLTSTNSPSSSSQGTGAVVYRLHPGNSLRLLYVCMYYAAVNKVDVPSEYTYTTFCLSSEASKSSVAHHALPIILVRRMACWHAVTHEPTPRSSKGALRPGTVGNPPFARPRPGYPLFRNHVYASHRVHLRCWKLMALPFFGYGFALSDNTIPTLVAGTRQRSECFLQRRRQQTNNAARDVCQSTVPRWA